MDENVAEVVIEEDEKLLREALEALEEIGRQARWDSQTNPFQVARLAQIKGITLSPITKLEERLLRE